MIKIKNATKQGWLPAYEGDGIDLSTRPQNHRGTVQPGMAQTIQTGAVGGVVIKEKGQEMTLEDKGTYLQLTGEGVYEKENRFYKSDAVPPTVSTCEGGNRQPKIIEPPTVIGGVGEKKSNNGTQYYLQDRIYKGDVSTTTTTSEAFQPYNAVEEGGQLRIRKLTPRECFRLMGVKDAEFERVQRHQSDSTLYHLAGDSIVTTCLMAIFGKLLGVEWQEKIKEVWPSGQ